MTYLIEGIDINIERRKCMYMSDLLSGKTAVVTGAASGIGREIALTFAGHGADVVIADIRERPREAQGEPTHETIATETDSRAAFVECDVTTPDDVRAAVDATAKFGGIDVMVNNAGIYHSGPFSEITGDDLGCVFDVNVNGTFFGAQAAAERMRETQSGSIINISSVAGLQGNGNEIVYGSSKGAVRIMTYGLAHALAPDGIRVNAIHPGLIQTSMTREDADFLEDDAQQAQQAKNIPLGRVGRPEDVANAALYLASELSDFVTAESLVVDGGTTNITTAAMMSD